MKEPKAQEVLVSPRASYDSDETENLSASDDMDSDLYPAIAARAQQKPGRRQKRKNDVMEYYSFGTSLLNIEVPTSKDRLYDPFMDVDDFAPVDETSELEETSESPSPGRGGEGTFSLYACRCILT